jgi:DNA-binding NtrC family response regulator
MKRILLVDDNRSLLDGMAETLAADDLAITLCETGAEATKRLGKDEFAVVVTDLRLPDSTGLDVLEEVKRRNERTVVLIITAHGTVDAAVAAMKAGAFDFVTKPFPADEIQVKVRKALDQYTLQEQVTLLSRETDVLRQTIKSRFDPDAIVGESPAIRQIKDDIERLAGSKVAVLVLGETGTGKELVARAIHYHSARSGGPFVPVNCAVFAESLLESELFGHEKGAFTGADARKMGRFELADQGTIFLDEVGELPKPAQAKLLRVLQEQEFERVGGTDVVRVDVRVVAATNRDLEAEVKRGEFREDLFYRLNVVPLRIPSLRERKEDIPSLVECFLARYAKENHKEVTGFTDEAMRRLGAYDWPGNVRELENTVERGVVLARGAEIHESILPFDSVDDSRPQGTGAEDGLVARVEDFERRLIAETLRACDGNTTKAAEKLGVSRSTLRYKIEKYSL